LGVEGLSSEFEVGFMLGSRNLGKDQDYVDKTRLLAVENYTKTVETFNII
jgi:hypothetical protein